MIQRFVLASAIALCSPGPASAGIQFQRGSLQDAVAIAEKEHKPVMIDFITDWCRWCDTLDARTYSDAAVASFINQNVIPIKVDAEKGEGITIAGKYDVHAFPTILLIRANGDEIDRLLGYVEAGAFLTSMQEYVKGVNTLANVQESLNRKPDDPSLHYAMASKYRIRENWKLAAEHYQRVLDLDAANALGHNEEAYYSVAMAAFRSGKDPSKLDTFMERYPASPMLKEALSSLVRSYTKDNDGPRARTYFDRYITMWPNDAAMMNNYAWGCAQHGINLDQARDMARKAVALAPKESERAMYLDTQATVEFTMGNTQEAIRLEQQALDLLKDATPKQRKDYDQSMAKFKAAQRAPQGMVKTQSGTSGATSGGENPRATGK